MRVGIPAETSPDERRVAMVPSVVAAVTGLGAEVAVQAGAGASAGFSDDAYRQAGATIVKTVAEVLGKSDVVAKLQGPSLKEARALGEGSALIALFSPARMADVVKVLTDRRITSFSLELLPRTTRAQAMDALSSQATVAGYRSVLVAAGRLPRFFPMLMTAAGTVPPAKVLILGAGVAGLQAIATAKRLGAVVSAYDVRAAARGEVESLGAKFIDLGLETAEGTGGYAAEQAEEQQRRQREAMTAFVAEADVVITTAQIPGRPAPVLLTGDMVSAMRPGSVVVDLASDTGGNVEVSVRGEEVDHGGVAVLGLANPASALATHASQMYARNIANLLKLVVSEGAFTPDFEDDIVAGTCVTRGGEIVHEPTRAALEGAPA
ncbi:MAG TPA: Re/Si-specific NAD(P)(+) transhydrogenase subunit alpha [Acidimicrobiales bacterium]|nr:Re/Si-specific NAD(P)(+) transhydrogenase subunit alpha [Acidimicrobiales bacterium]